MALGPSSDRKDKGNVSFEPNPLSPLCPLGTVRCLLGTGDNTDYRTDKRQDSHTSSFYRANMVGKSLEKH